MNTTKLSKSEKYGILSDDDYADECQDNYFEKEQIQFVHNKTKINNNYRCILMAWLYEVYLKYNVYESQCKGFLLLVFQLFDKYSDKFDIEKKDIQMVGCACYLLADRTDNKISCSPRDLTFLSVYSFDKKTLNNKSIEILESVGSTYQITSFHFLGTWMGNIEEIMKDNLNKNTKKINYIIIVYNIIKKPKYHPSIVAISSILLVSNEKEKKEFNALFSKWGKDENIIKECVEHIKKKLISKIDFFKRKFNVDGVNQMENICNDIENLVREQSM